MHLSYGNRLCLYLQDGYRRAPVRRVEPVWLQLQRICSQTGRSASHLVSRDANCGYLEVLFRKSRLYIENSKIAERPTLQQKLSGWR